MTFIINRNMHTFSHNLPESRRGVLIDIQVEVLLVLFSLQYRGFTAKVSESCIEVNGDTNKVVIKLKGESKYSSKIDFEKGVRDYLSILLIRLDKNVGLKAEISEVESNQIVIKGDLVFDIKKNNIINPDELKRFDWC
ncbi:MAG: hypothetical protein KKB03_03005 [Nanoarchaeota archaeon]|nr:hypothetical protein [Nanoarchaeota archaeon]MBU2520184.1 hypothetical protein [Nanoarchaeota archaeon]